MRFPGFPSARFRLLSRFAFLISAASVTGSTAFAQAKIVQTLEAFYSPSAVARTADGKTLYVANAARGDSGMLAGRGAVSMVSVGEDGLLKVEKLKLLSGLNAPSSLVVLPGPTGAGIPAGSLAVTVGGSWTVGPNGKKLPPREAGTGVAFFDPASGSELGRVYLGRGSPLDTATGYVIQDPSSIGADARGNIYVADMAGVGTYNQASDDHPGVLKLGPEAVASLVKGELPPAGAVWFAPVANVPMGLYYDSEQDALYWVTSNGLGDLGGAVFRLAGGDFSGATPLETVDKRLNSIAALTRTARGTLVCARNEGDLVIIRKRGHAKVVQFKKPFSFLSPGMFTALEAGPGSRCLLVIPELSGGGLGPWRQRLQVVELAGDF